MLLMLAHGLRRRKRRPGRRWPRCWRSMSPFHFIHAERIPTAVVAIVVLVALLYFRDEFYAEGDPRTRWRALWAFGGLIVADVVIGLTYILLARGLAEDYSFGQRVQEVIYGLVGVSGSGAVDAGYPRRPVQHLDQRPRRLHPAGHRRTCSCAPAEPRARLSQADAGRVRDLLAKYGDRDSLGYFALRDDKSVIWSPTGKACICYRVVSGVMLASGDPIGDPEAWPGAIGPFLDEAARHAWKPAVMAAASSGAEVWCREGGLTALELGDEAIVNTADFSLSGRSMRNVRQMVNRVAKHGYIAEVRRIRDIPADELAGIVKTAGSWLGGQTERGFSMALSRIGGPGDEDCVLATATEDGMLRAVLQLVPWGADGLSLDLMRRDKAAQPGLNDFLIVETIKAAPGLGVKRISAELRRVPGALERGERIGAGPVLRAWRSVLIFLSKWFQIESLYKFNAKFCRSVQPGSSSSRAQAHAQDRAGRPRGGAFLVWRRSGCAGSSAGQPGRDPAAAGPAAGPGAGSGATPQDVSQLPGLPGAAYQCRPLPGHGRGERPPDSSPTAAVVRADRPSRTAWSWPPRGPTSWTWGRVDPARRPAIDEDEELGGSGARGHRAGPGRLPVPSTPCGPGRGVALGAGRSWSTT